MDKLEFIRKFRAIERRAVHRGESVDALSKLVDEFASHIAQQTVTGSQKAETLSQITDDMKKWAESLDNHSSNSTFSRIYLWARKIQQLS